MWNDVNSNPTSRCAPFRGAGGQDPTSSQGTRSDQGQTGAVSMLRLSASREDEKATATGHPLEARLRGWPGGTAWRRGENPGPEEGAHCRAGKEKETSLSGRSF